jgi:hypothetical protein
MNNPISMDPWYALYPLPVGCTGNRLFEMLREADPLVTMSGYARRFERLNLVVGRWDAGKANVRAREMMPALIGRNVVLLGREVARAFGFDSFGPVAERRTKDGAIFHLLPHPSGRNPLYNDPGRRRAAGELLARLYAME